MELKPAKFKLEDMVLLAGQQFRVAGMVQLELPDAAVATRYLLSGEKGTSQILKERPGRFSVLRQFPPSAAPQPEGKELSVMGMRYALAGVDKLKVLGAEGGTVGAAPAEGLLLSGRFDGATGLILREFAPGGASAQTFYSVKPVAAEELLTAKQAAAVMEAERQVVQQAATAEAESTRTSGWAAKLAGWAVLIIVIVVLVFACSGPDDEGGSGSARSGSVHYSSGGHGGK
ncbi:MAG: hypothetical protein EXR31_00805 [Betaproteobacteria bacterium]|nr:hypothetical protein [Betaproteobacteria bacterium]